MELKDLAVDMFDNGGVAQGRQALKASARKLGRGKEDPSLQVSEGAWLHWHLLSDF